MEVDTETALSNRQNGTLLDIRRKLRDEKIRYNSLFVEKDQTIRLKVTDEAVFESATELLEDNYPQFVIGYTQAGDQFNISLSLSEDEIDQIEADAIDQNLTTLRNRVNELGVSEPIVQRQGKKKQTKKDFLLGKKINKGKTLS